MNIVYSRRMGILDLHGICGAGHVVELEIKGKKDPMRTTWKMISIMLMYYMYMLVIYLYTPWKGEIYLLLLLKWEIS